MSILHQQTFKTPDLIQSAIISKSKGEMVHYSVPLTDRTQEIKRDQHSGEILLYCLHTFKKIRNRCTKIRRRNKQYASHSVYHLACNPGSTGRHGQLPQNSTIQQHKAWEYIGHSLLWQPVMSTLIHFWLNISNDTSICTTYLDQIIANRYKVHIPLNKKKF